MSGVDRTSGRFGEPTPKRGSIVDAIETILLFPLGCLYAAERIFRPIGIRFPRLQIGTRYGAIPVALTYIALFLIAAAPAFYLGLSDVPAFNSPDEANGYITATMFAEHGRLYFQDELTEMSLERFPVGPRTFVQINGRGATQYPLGHPLTAGILHKLFGGAAPLVFAIVPGLTVLTLALLLRALVPTAPAYLGFTFIGTAPIWYWLSRLYMNVALELLFVSVGLLCFTLAIRRRSLWWFFGGSSGFALAALVRHPEAPMLLIVGLVFIIGMIRCFPPFQWSRTLQVAGVYAIPQVLFLVIPVAVTSWWTYGTPLTIGYLALYDNVAQERLPSDGNALLAPIKYFKLFFFPNPIEISVLWNIVRYQILFMLPIITGLGIAGALIARRNLVKTFGYPGVFLLAICLLYVLVSRSDPGVFGATITQPDLRTSVVRYMLPLYLALAIGAAYAASRIHNMISLLLVTVVVALSVNQVWHEGPESMMKLKQNVEQQRSAYRQVLETYTESDAMVFAAGTSDKHVALFRRTVGIWTRNPSSREIGQLSDVAAALSRIGRPLYIVAPAGAIDMTAVRQRLHSDSLYVEQLAMEHPRIELLRVSSPIQMLSISEGVYEANIPVLNDNFAIAIEWDGMTNNNIANPSFEYGLDGWRGPDGRIRVERSNEVTFSGRYSLKFAMEPGADNYEFARRTYSVDVEHLRAESWLAFGRVMASGLSDSQGEMRVYLRNESEQVIERHLILVTEDTHGFQTIGLGSRTLPNDAISMSLQLGLRGFSQDSAGTIYWDGMELVSGFSLPKEHCQGSDGECSWIGSSELVSGRMGDIESMKVKLDNGRVIDVGGPFYINDRLLFRSNQIFLERGPSTETHLADLPSGPTHGSIALQVISVMPPKMRITPIN